MKKSSKKLVLNRETLAGLDNSDLRQAAGGQYSYTPTRCPYSEGRNTCFTCEPTCTTNYC